MVDQFMLEIEPVQRLGSKLVVNILTVFTFLLPLQGGIEAERAAKEKLIEEEQRKMQESILALFNKREQNKAEREAKEMEAKSQLQKDIENVSIDKEVEQKVREDLGQIKDEQDKKKVEVPICNYGPGCRCNPEIKEDIFDQLEAGKEPEAPTVKKKRKKRNRNNPFEYNLKVDFHDANSNFYQLLSTEDEDSYSSESSESTEDDAENSSNTAAKEDDFDNKMIPGNIAKDEVTDEDTFEYKGKDNDITHESISDLFSQRMAYFESI